MTPEHSARSAERDAREPLAARVTPDLRPGERPVLGDIPWCYGQDRVTAMPVEWGDANRIVDLVRFMAENDRAT